MELNGPGKYDAICEEALIKAKAAGVLLIVLGGEHGNGFSMNAIDQRVIEQTPEILDSIAAKIRGMRDQ